MRPFMAIFTLLVCAAGATADNTSSGVTLDVSLRRAFVRMEKGAHLTVTLVNTLQKPVHGVVLQASWSWGQRQTFPVPDLKAGGREAITVPVDTRYAPGDYEGVFSVLPADGRTPQGRETVKVSIVPRRPPLKMPVVMWQWGVEADWAQPLGFTHTFNIVGDIGKFNMWKAKRLTEPEEPWRYKKNAEDLDRALKNDFDYIGYVCPGAFLNDVDHYEACTPYKRIDRDGKRYPNDYNICCNFPEVQQYGYNLGFAISKLYGEFPAFSGAMVETEVRDHSLPCFHPHDLALLQKDTGLKGVPAEVPNKNCVDLTKIKGISRGVVREKIPALEYLRWFWQKGDGWNTFETQTHRGLKANGNGDLWTYVDPAVRTPSISGSGGEVDFVSQWTYCYPDPIKIGKATDELFAMAELSGNPDQKVMKMTQAIWYRSATAPKRTAGDNTSGIPLVQWEKDKPNTEFITIAPDHLREAFWTKISRPVRGIMYHGWGALVYNSALRSDYCCTNRESVNVLQELARTVVKPLGPTLLQVPDLPSDIAFLQSFTSEMLIGSGEYGWTWGWGTEVYEILMYAQLQPKVVYEETIEKKGLAGYKVLVLVKCPYLPQKVVTEIKKFQNRGGIIIGDEALAAAISPDILLATVQRPEKAREGKAVLQDQARKLRKELDSVYHRYVDSSNPDVVTRARKYKSTDYIFLINDHRTYGNYVGQYEKVMEKGLPAEAQITIARKSGYVYDLVAHGRVDVAANAGTLRAQTVLGPGGGRLLMVTDRAISSVRVQGPEVLSRGQSAPMEITICDQDGNAVEAVVPLEVQVLDPSGKAAEYSGYYGAKDGRLTITPQIAVNDRAGPWTIKVTELAGGQKAEKSFKVVTPTQ